MKQTCEDFSSDALQAVALPTCCLLGGEEGGRADSSRIKFKVQNWVKFFSCLKFFAVSFNVKCKSAHFHLTESRRAEGIAGEGVRKKPINLSVHGRQRRKELTCGIA